MVRIRGFSLSDAESLVELHRQSQDSFELEVDESFIYELAMRSDFRFIVAEEEERVVGFVGVSFNEQVGRAEIGPICIEKGQRRRGIGKVLVEEVLAFLKTKEVHRVIAKVKESNLPAIRLFESCGFEVEALFEQYTKRGENVVQLVRFIKSRPRVKGDA